MIWLLLLLLSYWLIKFLFYYTAWLSGRREYLEEMDQLFRQIANIQGVVKLSRFKYYYKGAIITEEAIYYRSHKFQHYKRLQNILITLRTIR